MPLAELAHIEPDHGILVVEQAVGERLRQLRLSDTGRTEEQERSDGTTSIAHAGPAAAYGTRHGGHGIVLTDHASVQVAFEISETLALALGESAGGDAGGTGDHLGDLPLVDDRDACGRSLAGGCRVDPLLRRRDLIAQVRGILVLLGRHRRVLARLEVGELCHECRRVNRQAELQPQPGAGLIDQIDGLVRQHAIGQIAGAHRHGGAQGGVRVRHLVVVLVRAAKTFQDADGILSGGLVDLDRLETALQRRVLLDLAVLVERRGTDHVQLAARQAGLQDVSGIHRAFTGTARADHRVHLVDEDDDLVLAGSDLIHRLGQALLEISAVSRAGEHAGKIECDHASPGELRRDRAVDDRLSDAVGDRGLTDASLADQYRVVLGAAAEDLDRLLDLVAAADDRVKRAFAGSISEVEPVLVEHGCGGCRSIRLYALAADRRSDVLAHALGESFRCHAGTGEDLTGGHVLPEYEREEEVLGLDVSGAGRTGNLVCVEERSARARGDRGGPRFGSVAGQRQTRIHGVDDLGRGDADVLDRAHDGVVLDDQPQHMQSVELGLPALERESPRALQDALSARGQEPAEIDRSSLPGLFAREVPGEEVVERTGSGITEVACPVEVVRHMSS